jgi:hypothetical protein
VLHFRASEHNAAGGLAGVDDVGFGAKLSKRLLVHIALHTVGSQEHTGFDFIILRKF